MIPPCDRCVKVEEECQWKAWGLGCKRCAQWKVGCSVVGLKRKGSEKRAERRVTEDADEGPIALLELSDGVIEQVEAMVKELRRISGGIWVLVEGIGKLMEAMEGMKKEEVRKVDKVTETQEVQRVNKQTETEEKKEDSEEEEESEEEVEKEKKRDDREESKSESDRMEDGEEGGKKLIVNS
jgi:hypothetical protein